MERTLRVADIGGTKITVADVVGLKVMKEATFPKPEDVLGIVNLITKDLPFNCSGIGCACAGVIINEDQIEVSPNYQVLNGFRLGHHLSKKASMSAHVLNDMHAAVLGVMAMKPEDKDFILVNWGTGLNAWAVKDGRIVSHPEAGHMVIMNDIKAPACTCGRFRHYPRGHAEAYLNGPFVEQLIRESAGAVGEPVPDGKTAFKWLDERFDEGSAWANDLCIYQLGDPLAAFLVNLVTLIRPKKIYWRGTFAFETLPRIEDYVRSQMQAFLIEPIWATREVLSFEMTPARKQDALIGVASYVESEL